MLLTKLSIRSETLLPIGAWVGLNIYLCNKLWANECLNRFTPWNGPTLLKSGSEDFLWWDLEMLFKIFSACSEIIVLIYCCLGAGWKNLGLKLLRMLLDQSMLPKVKSSVSDFTSTQNLVENFGRVTSTQIW